MRFDWGGAEDSVVDPESRSPYTYAVTWVADETSSR
jgi:hypothetical protein